MSFDILNYHGIKSDIDYVGAYLFETVEADKLIPDNNVFDGLADTPPPISGYRKADVAGVACWNCGHFTIVGDPDNDNDVDGICNLFEAKADGEFTCDRFTAHSDLLRQSPHSSWPEDIDAAAREASMVSVDWADTSSLNEIAFLGAAAVEEDGLVWKDILRVGEWTHTPTNKGLLARKLNIIGDGDSDPDNGIISLSELETNFNDGAVPYVQVPLSDEEKKDHKNIAKVNTGFVRKLKKVVRDGVEYLRAGIEFTEPEVKEKVLRGTIPDCSAGVPYYVTRRKDNKTFKTVLDHVCLTGKPFIDGLGPFGLMAADGEDNQEIEVDLWELEDTLKPEDQPKPPETETEPKNSDIPHLTFKAQTVAIQKALGDQLRLNSDYVVEDIDPNSTIVTISHKTANMKWEVPFKLMNDTEIPVRLASVDRWKPIEEEAEEEVKPVAITASDELHQSQELRELRLAQPTSNKGGINMGTTAPSLEGVELSDEARTRVNAILAENQTLRASNREGDADKRIVELEGLGLKERPGALKLYRQVFLSDDQRPAMVLFADNQGGKEEGLTATALLDRFIEALKGDGGVNFSDQALESGNDKKPPATPDGELKPLAERVEDSKTALYGKGRRTGRK